MLDLPCRHQVWTRLEPSLHQSPTIESHLQAADVMKAVGFARLSLRTYGNPMTVADSDLGAWTADHQSIRPFRKVRS